MTETKKAIIKVKLRNAKLLRFGNFGVVPVSTQH